MVARPGKPKIVVLGFHPALSPMRYELSTPLLYANLLRWMAPEIFRRWELTAGSVGTVKVAAGCRCAAARPCACCATTAAPCPSRCAANRSNFSAVSPGAVRVLAGDREYVYSLTLPQLWESKWDGPAGNAARYPAILRRWVGEAPTFGSGWRWRAARDCSPSGFSTAVSAAARLAWRAVPSP